MKKLWLFIGRMNPPHKWHIAVIQKALSENEKVLVLLWCNGLVDVSNPLNFEQRESLLTHFFFPSLRLKGRCPKDGRVNEKSSNLEINIIKDTKTDLEWVQSIADSIQRYWDVELNIYGWDFEKDSAIIAIKQYELLLWEKINYIPVDRFLETVVYNWEQFQVSATNLRNALRNWDKAFVEKFCNEEIVEEIINYFK